MRQGEVWIEGLRAGTISETENGYLFAYDEEFLSDQPETWEVHPHTDLRPSVNSNRYAGGHRGVGAFAQRMEEETHARRFHGKYALVRS